MKQRAAAVLYHESTGSREVKEGVSMSKGLTAGGTNRIEEIVLQRSIWGKWLCIARRACSITLRCGFRRSSAAAGDRGITAGFPSRSRQLCMRRQRRGGVSRVELADLLAWLPGRAFQWLTAISQPRPVAELRCARGMQRNAVTAAQTGFLSGASAISAGAVRR